MGYYANITESTFVISKENLDEASTRLSDFSKENELVSANWEQRNGRDVAETVLIQMGFETSMDEDGLHIDGFDGKLRDQDKCTEILTDIATGVICWIGEDAQEWRETYGGPYVSHATRSREWIELG